MPDDPPAPNPGSSGSAGTDPVGPDPADGHPPAGLSEHLRPLPRRTGRPVIAAAVLALLAVAALWAAFTGIGLARWDTVALGEALEVRTVGLTEVAIVITTVGSTGAMAVLAVLVGAYSWVRGRRADAVLAIGAMAGASIVFRLLKAELDRQRPPVVDRLVPETNPSLPSGHATMSIVVIGTVVVLAWAERSAWARTAMVLAAAVWVGAVGGTRVYLGVHWFSDVLAGWLVGAAWLALCVLVWRRWKARSPAV